MPDSLRDAIASIVKRAGRGGITMGRLVDLLVADGAEEQAAELTVWEMMENRHLTPHGFACRMIRKPGANGTTVEQRTYEFVLISWSPDLDKQLDLGFDAADSDPSP